jgi:hypothetical protein
MRRGRTYVGAGAWERTGQPKGSKIRREHRPTYHSGLPDWCRRRGLHWIRRTLVEPVADASFAVPAWGTRSDPCCKGPRTCRGRGKSAGKEGRGCEWPVFGLSRRGGRPFVGGGVELCKWRDGRRGRASERAGIVGAGPEVADPVARGWRRRQGGRG